MRFDKRIFPIIVLIIAFYYAHDILNGNLKAFLKSLSLLNGIRSLRHFGRGYNFRAFSMINRGINSIKNQELLKGIIKNHNKKKNNSNNNNKTNKFKNGYKNP